MRPSPGSFLAGVMVVMALTSYACGDERREKASRKLPLFVPDKPFTAEAGENPPPIPIPEIKICPLKENDFEVDVLVDGAPLRKVKDARGQIFIAAEMGREYTVRLYNRSDQELNPVLWVDGINTSTLSFESVEGGWVLDAGVSYVVQGFRLDSRSLGSFIFTSPEESFAQARGYESRIGEIRVTVFVKEPPPKHRILYSFRTPAYSPGELGTGMGQRIHYPEGSGRPFRRDGSLPPLIVTLHYDSTRNLCARGLQEFCR